MSVQKQLGKQGEDLAVQFLKQKGFTILHRNWRHAQYEIDLIALHNQMLHFVEVKLRSSQMFGMPEENVNKKKMGYLFKAADEFLFRNKQYRHISFDILSIHAIPGRKTQYFFIEDVYL
jgi:putative endonuclease